jgi:ABC-type phosphate transport system substrate-binding protein
MKKFFPIVVLLLVAFATQVSAQSFQVIVNEGNATSSISKDDLSNIFLKKKTKWDDGSAVTPVDLNARSAVREAFSQDVHGRGVGAIRSYWQQAAFSGAGTAPLERSSDAEVIGFVKANPGAVGYISADTDAAGVKVLSVN